MSLPTDANPTHTWYKIGGGGGGELVEQGIDGITHLTNHEDAGVSPKYLGSLKNSTFNKLQGSHARIWGNFSDDHHRGLLRGAPSVRYLIRAREALSTTACLQTLNMPPLNGGE